MLGLVEIDPSTDQVISDVVEPRCNNLSALSRAPNGTSYHSSRAPVASYRVTLGEGHSPKDCSLRIMPASNGYDPGFDFSRWDIGSSAAELIPGQLPTTGQWDPHQVDGRAPVPVITADFSSTELIELFPDGEMRPSSLGPARCSASSASAERRAPIGFDAAPRRPYGEGNASLPSLCLGCGVMCACVPGRARPRSLLVRCRWCRGRRRRGQ